MFKKVLADRKVEVYAGKDVVDVRDPPEGAAGGTGTLVCSDGLEVGLSPPPPPLHSFQPCPRKFVFQYRDFGELSFCVWLRSCSLVCSDGSEVGLPLPPPPPLHPSQPCPRKFAFQYRDFGGLSICVWCRFFASCVMCPTRDDLRDVRGTFWWKKRDVDTSAAVCF